MLSACIRTVLPSRSHRRTASASLLSLLFLVAGIASARAAAPEERTPEQALQGLDVRDGLECTLFAAEPLLLSPSNIDVDHRGRVWVCEVVNYRGFRNKHPFRKEGDRILILEDTNGDGRADSQKVFYQGPDIDSAHGVCVLGNQVIVSAGDKVQILTDTDGDDRADDKRTLFSGISGTQHDHGIHSFLFGPDGRLYFNFGNVGKQLKDAQGKPIVDQAGNVIDSGRNPYQEGLVFRCELDGSNVETLAWNFRNNWEVCVDSFGTLWQSDNDDDGNRAVRINFVMEGGNYGYKDELTGAGWRTPRVGMREDVPSRHWHLNDPGVMPNLLQTGAGSPTGILIYEGNLLPALFRNQVIHTDAGPNVVRSYPAKPAGAGYTATIEPMLTGARDKWFRPSDVCAAPDGSLIVADWYDPGVGGHKMEDVNRGRLFRLAPPRAKWSVPKFDLSTTEAAATALTSPNLATRYLAWQKLHSQGAMAEPVLAAMFTNNSNPRFQARALWLLGQIPGRGPHWVTEALASDNADLRITGLRLARRIGLPLADLIPPLTNDPSPAVRRECAVALRSISDEAAIAPLWVRLARQHTAGDRWSLEALGIAARGRWDTCLGAWLKSVGEEWNTPTGREIIWRSRGQLTASLLRQILADPQLASTDVPKYLRAFDFVPARGRRDALAQLAFATEIPASRRNLVLSEALTRLKGLDLKAHPEYRQTVEQLLDESRGTARFAQLVDTLNLASQFPALVDMARQHSTSQLGVTAIQILLNHSQNSLLQQALRDSDVRRGVQVATALGTAADGRALGLLQAVAGDDDAPLELRRQAVQAAARSPQGAGWLIGQIEQDKLDRRLRQAAAASLHASLDLKTRQTAAKLFPLPAAKNSKPLPPLAELLKLTGNPARGRQLFHTTGTCAKCHLVGKQGKEVGPALTEIGGKLSRQAMFNSILFPSAGISHNYETSVVLLENGTTVTGIIISRSPDSLSIRGADAITRTFPTAQIDEIVRQDISLMPADVHKALSAQDLADIVDYMATLRKNVPGP